MGNPLKSEGAAFRWLAAVIAGAGSVIAVTVLLGSAIGAALGFILIAIVSVFIVKGTIHMLGSPDEDPPEDDSPREDPPRRGSGSNDSA